MSLREVLFLGTASQVPTRARNHNALFLFWDDLGILFDPGEGTQRQMTHAGLTAAQITHIAITHFHGDHCLGLAGLVQRLSLDRVPHPVEVIYPRGGQVFFERLRHASIFHDVANLVPRPVGGEPGEEIVVGRYGKARLLARALEHGVECYGYRLQEDDGQRMLPELLERAGVRGPDVGRLGREGQVVVEGRTVRVEEVSEPRPGQSFALTMDTRSCDGARQLARGADLLVSEATYLDSEAQEAHDHFHLTAGQAATLARDAGVRRLALTHFSQRYSDLALFRQEASAVHPGVFVAEDLARVAVPPRRSAVNP
jgi:ribonuclease Z